MNKIFIYFTLILIIAGCSGQNTKKNLEAHSGQNEKFLYTDKNGKYLVRITNGFDSKNKNYFLKKSIEIPERDKENILEQSITLSIPGRVKRSNILRPKLSQYTVWFDGKKYFSELKINPKKKLVEVKMQSPEANWNGTKEIKFPNTKKVTCFFSQLIECVRFAGYLDSAIANRKGKLNVQIIWEGYPYLNETYSDFPSELFSNGEIEYDGLDKNKEHKFNLVVAGQSIFYALDQNLNFKKMFWISQGITMIERSVANKAQSSSVTGEESD